MSVVQCLATSLKQELQTWYGTFLAFGLCVWGGGEGGEFIDTPLFAIKFLPGNPPLSPMQRSQTLHQNVSLKTAQGEF